MIYTTHPDTQILRGGHIQHTDLLGASAVYDRLDFSSCKLAGGIGLLPSLMNFTTQRSSLVMK